MSDLSFVPVCGARLRITSRAGLQRRSVPSSTDTLFGPLYPSARIRNFFSGDVKLSCTETGAGPTTRAVVPAPRLVCGSAILTMIRTASSGYTVLMSISGLFRSLESLSVLDKASNALQHKLRPMLAQGNFGTVLGGSWLGHPIHPALVLAPVGAWTSSVLLDWTGADSVASRRLIGYGLIAAPAAIVTGWADWSTLDLRQRRVGLIHAATNATAVNLFLLSYRRRKIETDRAARIFSVLGLLIVGTGGALGGHLVYSQGARVQNGESVELPGPGYDPAQLPGVMERASSVDN